MEGPFTPSARIYDVVYSHLDYPGSAALISALIRDRNPDASSLLDVACGTGLHLSQWRSEFYHLEGTDIDASLLEVARDRLVDITLHVADFTEFDLGRTFDAVTCLFSAIGYAHTSELLDRAVGQMARHLAPRGVLVVEPWLLPAMIGPPFLRSHVTESPEVVVLRTTRHQYTGDNVAGGLSDMEFAYVVTTDEGSEFFTERHVMGVYPPERYVEAFTKAGLVAEFVDAPTEIGRGLVIGVRPAS
jgi:SAM-dependent methyltransferase